MFLEFLAIHVEWWCYWKVCVGGLAASRLKATKQARLAERKVWFISDAGNLGGGGDGDDVSLEADSLPTDRQGVREFIEHS